MPDEMSAEELVDKLFDGIAKRIDRFFKPKLASAVTCGESLFSPADRYELSKLIKSDRARQREIGRAEMRSEIITACADNVIELGNRYAVVVEAARLFDQYEDGDAGKWYEPSRIKLGKALAALDEAKGV